MLHNTLRLDYIIMMANNQEFHNNDVHIARKVLENYNTIPNLSLDTLVQKIHISKQSFKKFYEQLGYPSYTEFKEDILFTKVVRKKQFRNRYRIFDQEKYISIFRQFTQADVSLSMIDSICEEIYHADKVIIYGSPTLLTKLLDFQLDMQMFSKVVITSSVRDGKLITPKTNDLVCICSSTGRIFTLSETEMKKNVIHSPNKKVLLCKQAPSDIEIDYILEIQTENDYYDLHYVFMFYIDLLTIRYYERYIKK